MNPNVGTFNPSVRIGNWNEDIQMEEDQLKSFLDKRDKGELMIQKHLGFISSMQKKLECSVSRDYSLRIGDHVMIKCQGTANASTPMNNSWKGSPWPRNDCVVAVRLLEPSDLPTNCSIRFRTLVATGSPAVNPNQRTVFSIESIEGGLKGYKVRHGEPFYLCTVSQEIGKLYLCSDRVAFNKRAEKSLHQLVYFTPHPSHLAQWMLQHTNPRLRLENEHYPVEANEECVLVHCKTNNCLAVEHDFKTYTPFGGEYELSTHSYLDSHRVEMDNNRWILVVGVPGSSVEPVPPQPALG
ncbi:hypothetical protein ACOMHN_060881 [Nucella lapillus]